MRSSSAALALPPVPPRPSSGIAPKPSSVPPPLPKRRAAPLTMKPIAVPRPAARSAPPPPPRLRGAALVESVVGALKNMPPPGDAARASRFCLETLERMLPCRTSIVHLFDRIAKNFVVLHARGECEARIRQTLCTENDPILRVAMPYGEPFLWPDLRRSPIACLARFRELAGIKTVLVAPVVDGARWIGAIELVDPLDGGPFSSEDVVAAQCVADRLAFACVLSG